MSKHAFDKKILDLHKKESGTEGGACLNRHISGVSKSSCSHRWQARERAAEAPDQAWYNGKRPGWDVVGQNFMKSSRRPYWHQAHHIIPNRVLNGCILDAATQSKSFTLYRLIRIGLLDAKYNLNHKTNMILLPMSERTAAFLKLPKHLEAGARSHEDYSNQVKEKVDEVIRSYKRVAEDAKEDHKAPPADLAKSGLERISRLMRKAIRAWGESQDGGLLDQMTSAHIANHFE